MNKKIIFLMAIVLLLTLSCSVFSSSSPAPAALSTSGVSAELAATMTSIADGKAGAPDATEAVVLAETAPQATQPGIAATQPGIAATQPGIAATQPGIAATQPGIAGGATPLDTTFTVQADPIQDERIYQAKAALQEMGYEICSGGYINLTPFYTAQAASAVSQFQANNNLPVTGDLDPATWDVLFGADPQPALQEDPAVYEVAGAVVANFPTDIAVFNGAVWTMPQGYGFVEVFDPTTSEVYQGIYGFSMLPGEEYYQPMAMTSDGEQLWTASLGGEDAIIQAFDIANANPVEGLLNPVLEQSIHFNTYFIYGLAYDGMRFWASGEGEMGGQLISIDPVKGTSETFNLPFETYPSAGAWDPANRLLWVPVVGVAGDAAILAVDPRTGPTGDLLGVCGTEVAYGGGLLWVVKADRIVGVDPASGTTLAVVYLDEPAYIGAIVYESDRLWLLNADTGVILIVELR